MEEDQYKATYNELASNRCVFEKALTNNHARCTQSKHFWLADREGYACQSEPHCQKCQSLLEQLRLKSSFVLKLTQVSGPLPHNMDIRVQAGGMKGLAALIGRDQVDDIHTIIDLVELEFQSFEHIPYSQVMPFIDQFEGRRRRRKK